METQEQVSAGARTTIQITMEKLILLETRMEILKRRNISNYFTSYFMYSPDRTQIILLGYYPGFHVLFGPLGAKFKYNVLEDFEIIPSEYLSEMENRYTKYKYLFPGYLFPQTQTILGEIATVISDNLATNLLLCPYISMGPSSNCGKTIFIGSFNPNDVYDGTKKQTLTDLTEFIYMVTCSRPKSHNTFANIFGLSTYPFIKKRSSHTDEIIKVRIVARHFEHSYCYSEFVNDMFIFALLFNEDVDTKFSENLQKSTILGSPYPDSDLRTLWRNKPFENCEKELTEQKSHIAQNVRNYCYQNIDKVVYGSQNMKDNYTFFDRRRNSQKMEIEKQKSKDILPSSSTEPVISSCFSSVVSSSSSSSSGATSLFCQPLHSISQNSDFPQSSSTSSSSTCQKIEDCVGITEKIRLLAVGKELQDSKENTPEKEIVPEPKKYNPIDKMELDDDVIIIEADSFFPRQVIKIDDSQSNGIHPISEENEYLRKDCSDDQDENSDLFRDLLGADSDPVYITDNYTDSSDIDVINTTGDKSCESTSATNVKESFCQCSVISIEQTPSGIQLSIPEGVNIEHCEIDPKTGCLEMNIKLDRPTKKRRWSLAGDVVLYNYGHIPETPKETPDALEKKPFSVETGLQGPLPDNQLSDEEEDHNPTKSKETDMDCDIPYNEDDETSEE